MNELITILIILVLCGVACAVLDYIAQRERKRRIRRAWEHYEAEQRRKREVMESYWTYPNKEGKDE